MDSTREILEAHYPRCRWTRLGTHWSGRCGSVMVALYPTNTGWCADGQTAAGATLMRCTGADMHAALRDLAMFHPSFVDALHPTPYEQPQSTPFPALLLRKAWAALWPGLGWLLLLGAMALACGAGGMWTITGGGQ